MNDGNQPTDNQNGDSHCITSEVRSPGKGRIPAYVFDQPLPSGQSWEITVLVMEEDGGNPSSAWSAVKDSLAASDNPYGMAGAGLMQILDTAGIKIGGVNAPDTNDFIGAFAGKLGNYEGHVIGDTLRAIDRVERIDPEPHYEPNSNRKVFYLNGDGSKYEVWPLLDLID